VTEEASGRLQATEEASGLLQARVEVTHRVDDTVLIDVACGEDERRLVLGEPLALPRRLRSISFLTVARGEYKKKPAKAARLK
jgi:hypothetical protein